MPYPGQFYPGQYYPSQQAGPDQRLGTDSGALVESTSLVVWASASDTASGIESRSGAQSATGSDFSALNDSISLVASNVGSDIFTFSESQTIFQGLLKDTSDLFSVVEQVSLQVFLSRTDLATQADNQTGATNTPVNDLGMITDYKQSQGPLVFDLGSFSDLVQPRFNYLWSADSFTALDIQQGNFQFSVSDLIAFYEDANVFHKQIVTEDPFIYPVSYYGSERIRVIAQDHFTREFIHWDLPIDNIQLTFTLSGPNLFSGTISTEIESLLNLNPPLMPDRTWIHVEQGNTIIASFILTPFIDNPQNQTRQIEGEGFGAYPSWIYYEGDQYIRIQTDPADIIRYIWDHIQSFPDGNLGVKVWPTVTPVRVGYPNTSVTFTTKEMNEVSITGEPYNLNFWSVINCGEEINRICQETPIEYWEYSQWNEFKSDVEHYIVLGYPRVGRKRTDLVFREGENLVQLIPSYQETQENYASDVFVIGAGEGPGAVRAKASGRIGRLRKTNVIQDQTISNKARAQSIADFEFKRIAKSRFLIENILVDTTHTNARWGTFIAGDDIFVQGNIPYVGFVQDWYRIVNYTFEPYARVATLNLEPSDSFSYGATFFDQFADLPHEGFAVLSDADFGDGEGTIDVDQQEAINIKLCQQQGVEAFNKKNVVNGMAYAYKKVGTTINYALSLMSIDQVVDPFQLVIGRTQQGYLITGANVYLVASNGTIGQAPETTATQPSSTAPSANGWTPNLSGPYPVALRTAAREYYNAYTANIRINSDLSYMGISANAESWRSTIGYMFYTLSHGQYNYAANTPGGGFVYLITNIINNIGTA